MESALDGKVDSGRSFSTAVRYHLVDGFPQIEMCTDVTIQQRCHLFEIDQWAVAEVSVIANIL